MVLDGQGVLVHVGGQQGLHVEADIDGALGLDLLAVAVLKPDVQGGKAVVGHVVGLVQLLLGLGVALAVLGQPLGHQLHRLAAEGVLGGVGGDGQAVFVVKVILHIALGDLLGEGGVGDPGVLGLGRAAVYLRGGGVALLGVGVLLHAADQHGLVAVLGVDVLLGGLGLLLGLLGQAAVVVGVPLGLLLAADQAAAGVVVAVGRTLLLAADQVLLLGVAGSVVGVAVGLVLAAGQLALFVVAAVAVAVAAALLQVTGQYLLDLAAGVVVDVALGLLQAAGQAVAGVVVGVGLRLLLAADVTGGLLTVLPFLAHQHGLVAVLGVDVLFHAADQHLVFHGDGGEDQHIGGDEHHHGGECRYRSLHSFPPPL